MKKKCLKVLEHCAKSPATSATLRKKCHRRRPLAAHPLPPDVDLAYLFRAPIACASCWCLTGQYAATSRMGIAYAIKLAQPDYSGIDTPHFTYLSEANY
jgi:hypothetical protein